MSVFMKIIEGELPCYKVAENDHVISFLALDQVQPGHCLVIPKIEVDMWHEVPELYYLEVMKLAKSLGPAIHKATGCRRVGTATVGFEVPHFHLHLIPMWQISDLDFSKGRQLPADEMESICQKIREQLV